MAVCFAGSWVCQRSPSKLCIQIRNTFSHRFPHGFTTRIHQSITALAPGWQPKSSSTCSQWLPQPKATQQFVTHCWELDSPTDNIYSQDHCLIPQKIAQISPWHSMEHGSTRMQSALLRQQNPTNGMKQGHPTVCQDFCHDPVNWDLHSSSYPQLYTGFPLCTALFDVTCIRHCWKYFLFNFKSPVYMK